MNIYWEEHDSASERPKHWSEEGDKGTLVAKIELPPQPVGGYDITGNGGTNGYMFMFLKKPNWFHRTCSRFFLGWEWVDKNGLNKK